MEQREAPNYARSFVNIEVKASNTETREVAHLITTGAVDRQGDVVEPAGAHVDNFLKNPVVMVDHSYLTEHVVGKAVNLEVNKDGIWARTQFRDTPLARDAFALASEGLGGWSIGFRPIAHEARHDEKGNFKGFHFKEWELLEYSIVPIPMNQEIVNGAVKRGLLSEQNVKAFFEVRSVEAEPNKAKPEPEKRSSVDLYGIQSAVAKATRRLATHDAGCEMVERLRKEGIR